MKVDAHKRDRIGDTIEWHRDVALWVSLASLVISALAFIWPLAATELARREALGASISYEGAADIVDREQTVIVEPINYSGSELTLWVVVHAPNIDRWYPTRLVEKSDDPVNVPVVLGAETDSGEFQVFVYAVAPLDESVFNTAPAGGLTGLPGGAQVLAEVSIRRTS